MAEYASVCMEVPEEEEEAVVMNSRTAARRDTSLASDDSATTYTNTRIIKNKIISKIAASKHITSNMPSKHDASAITTTTTSLDTATTQTTTITEAVTVTQAITSTTATRTNHIQSEQVSASSRTVSGHPTAAAWITKKQWQDLCFLCRQVVCWYICD